MDKFDRLNLETREHNHHNVDRFNLSTPAKKTSFSYFEYLNRQTFLQKNGQLRPKDCR